MDSSQIPSTSCGRYGGCATASGRWKQTRSSHLPISCVDSSVQARVVMEQISRERSQLYQQSVIQTVLGPHDMHRLPSDAKPKLKLPNIDDKNQALSRHQLNAGEYQEVAQIESPPRNCTSAQGQSTAGYMETLSHANKQPGGILQSSRLSCSSASSFVGRKVDGLSQHHTQRRPGAAVYKNGAVLRPQPTIDHNANDGGTKTNPRRRQVRRRYVSLDTMVPRRARSQSSGRGVTNPPTAQTRKRRGSNLDSGRSQSDQDIPTTEARYKQPNLQHKTKHISQSQDKLNQSIDRQNYGPTQTCVGPTDRPVPREKSFEITFPGYDTRFADLPDPNAFNEKEDLTDFDRKIESQIHSSSIEKCRRWLNKWVLTT